MFRETIKVWWLAIGFATFGWSLRIADRREDAVSNAHVSLGAQKG